MSRILTVRCALTLAACGERAPAPADFVIFDAPLGETPELGVKDRIVTAAYLAGTALYQR